MIILVKTRRKNWLSFLDLGSQHLHLYRIMFINMYMKQLILQCYLNEELFQNIPPFFLKKGIHLERHIVLWINSCHQTYYNWERCLILSNFSDEINKIGVWEIFSNPSCSSPLAIPKTISKNNYLILKLNYFIPF